MGKHNSVEQYDAAKRAAQEARLEELRNKNFFGVRLQGSYDDGLSTEEIKFLRANNKSFLDVMTTIDGFRKLTAEQQEAFFSEANEATRISLENDGYISAEIQSFAKSPEEAEEIIESRRAAEQTKLFQQSREAEEEIARQEKLYPGVEVVDGKYRLTIDPEDGTAPEVFWGETKEKPAFEDRHESTQAYIDFMRPRCVELARVLKKTGSFYYHCDWHASHYVKVMLAARV